MIQTNIKNTLKKAVTDDMRFRASEEAQICLSCPLKKCNGSCDRLRSERKKLKGAK